MRNRMQGFMDGRYGNDQLNQFLSIAALVLIVLNIFIRVSFLWLIGIALLIWVYFRMFSRNTSQRAVENDRFIGFFSRFRRGGGGFRGGRNSYGGSYGGRGSYGNSRSSRSSGNSSSARERAERFRAQQQDKRYYKYFNCPNCNQKVRVPKGKGKIEITCPKCHTSFIRKT